MCTFMMMAISSSFADSPSEYSESLNASIGSSDRKPLINDFFVLRNAPIGFASEHFSSFNLL